jgi:two-component system chemotaxis sensor kinase CheA
VKVRDEYMPVIDLEKVFEVPRFDLDKSSNIMVVVEAKAAVSPCWWTSCWGSTRWW